MANKMQYYVDKIIMKMIFCRLLNWLPDSLYLKLIFRTLMHEKLNLKDPKSFNEKLQWLKLYDRNPLYTCLADKYESKQYVADKLGTEYVFQTLGVWDKFDEIDFEKMPDRFVLKCTHDSGSVYICRDRQSIDMEKVKSKIEKSLDRNYYWLWREWQYKNIKPRVICEEYMENSEIKGLRDYKFFCFNGKARFVYVSEGLENHSTAKVSFLTLDWEIAPFGRKDYAGIEKLPPRPDCFMEMISIAEKLSDSIPFVRIDLYEINNRVFFSEFTFSPCAGYLPFSDREWDLKLGEMIKLNIN